MLKILLYFFKHDFCNAYLHWLLCLFLNMLMFNCLLNNVKAETNGKKYTLFSAILFLICPSDNYSVYEVYKKEWANIVDPDQTILMAVPWFLKISA